jgi:hypothetical protein
MPDNIKDEVKEIWDKIRKREIFGNKFLLFLGIGLAVYASVFAAFVFVTKEKIQNAEPSGIIAEVERSALGGEKIILGKDATSTPLAAVMIDNFFDSRPAVGLSKAIFVWEAPVEAGITRFLAIFPLNKEVEKIGPVRSLRPYYIDWATEINAVIAHCGGSPEALKKAVNLGTRHLDEYYNGRTFWRTWTRPAPHNLLTSTENLKTTFEEKGYLPKDFGMWIFKDDALRAERPAEQEITLDFNRPEHKVLWKYDPAKNDYTRWQNSAIHTDEAGDEIHAKNIAVQFTEIKILDSVGRREIKTTGQGDALVFLDGKKIEAVWKKPSREERTRFYRKDTGVEIEFNAGITWIEVMPIGAKVEAK